MPKTSKIRVFADIELTVGSTVELTEAQSHYLLTVMRLQAGERILVFNGRSGEFECTVMPTNKKHALLKIETKTRDFETVPDVWLMFAPLKKDRTDFVIEKATELGASKIVPVITQYTISDKIRSDRWLAQATEAAEQSRRVEVPDISEAVSLTNLLRDWDSTRRLYFMDETGSGDDVSTVFSCSHAPAGLLIGPEGGFSEQELNLLHSKPYARAVSLGKRILRAETAAVAALSCWQALSGDWKKE